MSCVLLFTAWAMHAASAQDGHQTATTQESGMHEYQIKVQTKDNKRITDSVKASSKFDAEDVMRSRYPNCVILETKQIN